MHNAKDWGKLLIIPLLLVAAWQADSATAEEATILEEEPVLEMPHGEIMDFGTSRRACWFFRADGLALKRDASGDRAFAALATEGEIGIVQGDVGDEPLLDQNGDPVLDLNGDPVFVALTQQPGSMTSVLGTPDLNFEFQGGYRLTLGRTLGDWHWLEFTYFDLNDWNETAAVRDTTENQFLELGSLFSPFTDFGNPAVEALDYNNFVSITCFSTLDSMELNLYRRLPMPPGSKASVLLGVRYMNILEDFQYYSESDVPVADTNVSVNTRTGNSLVGVQIGAIFGFPVQPRGRIEWELKGAICHNRADQHTTWSGGQPRGLREARTAFVGETSVVLVCQVTPRLTAYGGYQGIWVDGLALASENVPADANILELGPARLDHGGKVVYHGPHIGLSLVW